jgi:hypothetical protein
MPQARDLHPQLLRLERLGLQAKLCGILETGNDSFRFKQRRKQPKPGG